MHVRLLMCFLNHSSSLEYLTKLLYRAYTACLTRTLLHWLLELLVVFDRFLLKAAIDLLFNAINNNN